MLSAIYGNLPLLLYPTEGAKVTEGGRTEICSVRGEVFGQHINVRITLDVNTGELLVMSPDNFVGSFRMGDLIAAHVHKCMAYSMRERQEALDAQTH